MSTHDDDMIGTILTRRQALRLLGGSVVAGGVLCPTDLLAALHQSSPTTRPREPFIATPAQTPGPFFNDEKLRRADIRGNGRAAVDHAPTLDLTFAIYRLDGKNYAPMPGVTLNLWNCDALGVYSGEPRQASGEDTSGQTWLRGFQTTDDAGLARFTTIVPGWYPGRTPHLHFMVRPPADGPQRYFASQLYFDGRS